ncbi:MAG TPA: serine/threonine protein kinase, partial [Verrucomicrobiae bacterium]|nr:serine/threonine protein kinase [Verrucomicrobiae bacterium]
DITQLTSDALVKVMAKNPADRFLSYDEFIITLEAARSMLLRQSQARPNPKSLSSWWRRP